MEPSKNDGNDAVDQQAEDKPEDEPERNGSSSRLVIVHDDDDDNGPRSNDNDDQPKAIQERQPPSGRGSGVRSAPRHHSHLGVIIPTTRKSILKNQHDANDNMETGNAQEFPDDDNQSSSSSSTSSKRTSWIHANWWLDLEEGQAPWVQILVICLAAALTYSYNQTTNVQLAVMTVIVLWGASPLAPPHMITVALGAFVGGHELIGSNKSQTTLSETTTVDVTHYVWLLLLSVVVGWVWCFVMVKFQILVGYSGRLGTTTFVGTNLVMITLFGPCNVVHWNRYYYGFAHMKRDDSSWTDAWSPVTETESSVGYVLAVLIMGVLGGWIRIRHHQYIEDEWEHRKKDQLPPKPLNNVLFPCVLALLGMLLVNATEYKHRFAWFNGFAVGAYVAMASLQKLSTTLQFAMASAFAAAWGLFLTPVFVGFAGKSGFTSMLGHVTFVVCHKAWNQLRQRSGQHKKQEEEEVTAATKQQPLQPQAALSESSSDDQEDTAVATDRRRILRGQWQSAPDDFWKNSLFLIDATDRDDDVVGEMRHSAHYRPRKAMMAYYISSRKPSQTIDFENMV